MLRRRKMNFIEQIEESPAKLIATALTLNLAIFSWVLERFLKTDLIAFGFSHPDGNILILTIIVLFILTYVISGKLVLLKKFFSFFD